MSEKFMDSSHAYKAMLLFLERYYEMTNSDELGALLGSMNLLEDGKPADGAIWDEWMQAIQDVEC
jgi:hypothetical protein